MPLEATQAAFAGALLDPEAALPEGIIDPHGKPAPKRFAVYRNNVTVSLIEALATAFPTIEKILGAEFFNAMAREYVRAHPPASPLLMFYGESFPEFLSGFEPVGHLPYLADVATLEQVRRQSYHAADAELADPEFFSTITPDDLGSVCFEFIPSMYVLTSDHPVLAIWEWNAGSDAGSHSPLPEGGEDVLIFRPELQVEMRRLPPGGAEFLRALSTGATLGEAATAGAETEGFDLTQSISGMIECRIITAFTLTGATS